MAKKRKYFVVHWAATSAGQDVTMSDLHQWHIVQRKWDRYGYSDLIQLSGKIINITPYDDDALVQQHEKTWGARGINAISRHVCIAAGPNQPISPIQYSSLLKLIHEELQANPNVLIIGHNQANNTLCPGFSVPDWLRANNVPNKNIYTAKIPEYN
jgi:N-acetylmuramoyl-L-alanine amidase